MTPTWNVRIGPLRFRNVGSAGGVWLLFLTGPILYLLGFAWYVNTVVARPHPTGYTNAFWGWLHGVFAVPSFLWSLFADNIAIYQAPNSGAWYNLGYLVGIAAALQLVRGPKA